jgi:flagellar protein FlaG
MANELTTQQVTDRAVKGHSLALGGVDKAKAPVRRDNTVEQPTNARAAELEAIRKQLPEDTEKVKEMVKETVDYFNDMVKELQVDLKYEVDDATDAVIIKFFEKGTDKLIRQFPPEEIIHLKQRISDLLGIIYDETA